MMQNMTLNVI